MSPWTQYDTPVIPNTVHYKQDASADNMSTTTTAGTTKTTSTVDYPPLPDAHLLKTTTTKTPIPPPILTGFIGHNPLVLQNVSPLSQSTG